MAHLQIVWRNDPAAFDNATFLARLAQIEQDLAWFGCFTKAGIPTDADVGATPQDGMLCLDTTDSKLYARVGGAWKSVLLA